MNSAPSNDNLQRLYEVLVRLRDALQGFQPTIESIDALLNHPSKPLDADHPETYDKLNWETRTGEKGPFQMLQRGNCNNTRLFNHLEAILKQNKNNITIGDHHYWAGDPGYIFRRKKKP